MYDTQLDIQFLRCSFYTISRILFVCRKVRLRRFYSNKAENGININYLFYIRNCKVFVIVAKSFHTTDFAGSCA